MTPKFVVFVALLIGLPASSCSGKGGEVGAVVATAATLKAVQTAREQRKPTQLSTSSQGDCCVVCTECTFPCGDSCVPNGTLCTRPKGCACTDEEAVPDGTPPREPNPINCDPQMLAIEL